MTQDLPPLADPRPLRIGMLWSAVITIVPVLAYVVVMHVTR